MNPYYGWHSPCDEGKCRASHPHPPAVSVLPDVATLIGINSLQPAYWLSGVYPERSVGLPPLRACFPYRFALLASQSMQLCGLDQAKFFIEFFFNILKLAAGIFFNLFISIVNISQRESLHYYNLTMEIIIIINPTSQALDIAYESFQYLHHLQYLSL